jgi:hypothetical protein
MLVCDLTVKSRDAYNERELSHNYFGIREGLEIDWVVELLLVTSPSFCDTFRSGLAADVR